MPSTSPSLDALAWEAPLPAALFDARLACLRANAAWRAALGSGVPAGASPLAAALARVRDGGAAEQVQLVPPGGAHLGAHLVAHVFPGGEPGQVAVVAVPAPGPSAGEREAREAAHRLAGIFEAAGMGILEIDPAGVVLAANGRICAMLGYGPGEVVGLVLDELTAPQDRARTRSLHERVHAGALDVFDYEKRYLRRDGAELWVHVTVSAVRDAEGRHQRSVATVEDVSDRKRMEAERERALQASQEANERLRDADRRKDEFLGMLSHELRNPLAPIRNAIYVLARAPDGAHAAGARAVIQRQTEHLTRIVDDLLDVTRIARGKIAIQRERLDLAELARRGVDDHRTVLAHAGVGVALELPAGPVWVEADPTRLAQVLGNLLQNAAKFTPSGGRVTVGLRVAGEEAELRVADTGVGIEPALQARLFQPFVQSERSLARTQGGLGLGLALVRGIAELHGGAARVASAGSGRGSEFVVTLPLAPAAVAPGWGRRAAASPLVARRVLVVDDNEDAAETLAELVRYFGHAAEVAHDGPEALERARAFLPDAVLCDIGLPGMSGYDVARALRSWGERGAALHLVAVSGYAQPEDLARAAEAGFDAHVAKPADAERIRVLLAEGRRTPPPRAGAGEGGASRCAAK